MNTTKFKTACLAVICLISLMSAAAQHQQTTPVTSQMALNLAKSMFQDQDYWYAYGKVKKPIDGACGCKINESIYLSNPWIETNDSLWVIFVDQKPMQNWEHACKFVYFPTIANNPLLIPSIVVDGNRPPHSNNVFLTPWGKNGEGIRHATSAPAFAERGLLPPRNVLHQTEDDPFYRGTAEGNKTYAILVNCAQRGTYNSIACYNDMQYLFEVLASKYGIPFYNFCVFMHPYVTANLEDYYYIPDTSFSYMNEYADGYSPTKQNLIEYFREFRGVIQPDEHLFVFFDGHGGYDEVSEHYYVTLLDQDLYDFELKDILDSIPAKHQTIVMQNCHSGGFISAIEAPGRTVITACDADEESLSFTAKKYGPIFSIKNAYNMFSHIWTSALNGERLDYLYDDSQNCIDGTIPRPFNADIDRNGRVTLEESFICAYDSIQAYIDWELEHNFRSVADGREHAQYSSSPLSVGEDLAFNNIPDSTLLYVRDNVADEGKEKNTTTSIYWDSPDIWTSNSNNLSESQLNNLHLFIEPIDRANTNLYTYVRITNRGICNYNGTGKYLHLLWSAPALNQSPSVWMGMDNYIPGGFISSIEISERIPVGESRIITVPWTLPNAVYNKAISTGTDFSFSILAHISNSPILIASEISDSIDSMITPVLEHRDIAQKGFQFTNSNGGSLFPGFQVLDFSILSSEQNIGNSTIDVIDDDGVSLLSRGEITLSTSDLESNISSSKTDSVKTTTVRLTRLFKQNNQENNVIHAVMKDELQKVVGGASMICVNDTSNTDSFINSFTKIQSARIGLNGNIQITTTENAPSLTSISVTSTLHPTFNKHFCMAKDTNTICLPSNEIPDGPCVINLLIRGIVVDSKQVVITKK